MKNCKQCGELLPPRKPSEAVIKIAKKNIDHLTKYLTEGIIHESYLILSGEYSWDNALCEKCKSK